MDPKITKEAIHEKVDEYFAGRNPKCLDLDLNVYGVSRACPQGKGPRELSRPETLVKGGHQYCISNATLANAATALVRLNLPELEATNFEDIHWAVLQALDGVKRIGALTVYDIALRVAWLKTKDLPAEQARQLMPKRYVYLHSGAYYGFCEAFQEKDIKQNVEYVTCGPRRCMRIDTDKLADLFMHAPNAPFTSWWEDGDDHVPSCIIENILCVEFKPGKNKSSSVCCC